MAKTTEEYIVERIETLEKENNGLKATLEKMQAANKQLPDLNFGYWYTIGTLVGPMDINNPIILESNGWKIIDVSWNYMITVGGKRLMLKITNSDEGLVAEQIRDCVPSKEAARNLMMKEVQKLCTMGK